MQISDSKINLKIEPSVFVNRLKVDCGNSKCKGPDIKGS